mgnify:CR=1 FL=1
MESTGILTTLNCIRVLLYNDERLESIALVGLLRGALARAGVSALEPDLVILDEFQRFRHLHSPFHLQREKYTFPWPFQARDSREIEGDLVGGSYYKAGGPFRPWLFFPALRPQSGPFH